MLSLPSSSSAVSASCSAQSCSDGGGAGSSETGSVSVCPAAGSLIGVGQCSAVSKMQDMFTKYLKKLSCMSYLHCLKQDAQLSLGYLTVLVISNLQGHLKSMISISSDREYATSY